MSSVPRYTTQEWHLASPSCKEVQRNVTKCHQIGGKQAYDNSSLWEHRLSVGSRQCPYLVRPARSPIMADPSSYFTLNTLQRMPRIGLGTHYLNGEHLRTALEVGYRHIDTAFAYQNEEALGGELSDWFQKGKLERGDVFVTAKLPITGNRPESVEKFLQLSLQRLKLSYVDLYLIHAPFGLKSEDVNDTRPKGRDGKVVLDPETNLEELWKAMEDQVDKQKTRAVGVSNFNAAQLERIVKVARIKPAVNEVEANTYMRQAPLHDLCKKLGIAVVAFAPLGAPYKPRDGDHLLSDPVVLQIAQRLDRPPSQVLLRHLLQHGFIVIPRSRNEGRMRSNLQALDFTLSQNDMEALDHLNKGPEARIFDASNLLGVEHHPEYPFKVPF